MSLPPVRRPRRKVVSSYKNTGAIWWTFTATLACGHVLDYVSPYKGSCPKAVSCYKCLKARKEEEDRMDTKIETETATESKKPRKPMSEEQKEKIRQAMKKYQRKLRAESGEVAAPAPKKAKKKAKGKKPLRTFVTLGGVIPSTEQATAAVEEYWRSVHDAQAKLRKKLGL